MDKERMPRLHMALNKAAAFSFEGLRRADARARLLALCGFQGDSEDYLEQDVDRALMRAAQEALQLHRLRQLRRELERLQGKEGCACPRS